MRNLKLIFIEVFFLSLISNIVFADEDFGQMEVHSYPLKISEHQYVNGYKKSISGSTINYHSPSPDIQSALLVRATDGEMSIEWETDAINLKADSENVKIIWLAGLGCNLGQKAFDLYLNDAYLLTFRSYDRDKWIVTGESGTELSFMTTMIDNARDRFGPATLSVPKTYLKDGQPLRLRIVGHKSGSNAWVMTFQGQLSEKITIASRNAIRKDGNRRFQPVDINLTYFGDPVSAVIKADGITDRNVDLEAMFTNVTLPLPEVEKKQKVNINIEIDSKEILSQEITISPIRKFTVYMVQHTHTDIGYTRPQTEILPEHLRYIDYALDFCDQTDDYPDESKFRWTCEASWAVREYLKNRPPEQIERLRKRVREGRIELTGMMFNVSDIVDENSFVDFVQALRLFKENDLPVKTAMQNDVNGFAWCLVDYFKDTGVEYLTMGTHGHKALIAFEHPTPFWMESLSGNRLLTFRADHYMTGNWWGIHNDDLMRLESDFFKYLRDLFDKGYPYDKIAVQHSGYMTDNSPPSLSSSDLIRKWNEKYEWPKLKTAVARDFMDEMKTNHNEQLPVYRATWPDWWTDGFGSSARETAAARFTHAEMIANLGLLSMAKLAGARLPEHIHDRIRIIQDALLFYDEHTFGAAESISDPMSENSQVQWMQKAAYVWDAVKNSRLLTETGMGLLQPFISQGDAPTITFFNTLNWNRSGWLKVYVDDDVLPKYKEFSIRNEQGEQVAAQIISSRSEGNYWAMWADDIPALGYKTFQIYVSDNDRPEDKAFEAEDGFLENKFYRIRLNPEKGTIISLYDKELNQELVDSDCEWELGQFIYETTGYRGQLDRFVLENYNRTTLRDIVIEPGIDGALWRSIVVRGNSEGFDNEKGVKFEIRLFHHVKRIEFWYSIRKQRVRDPEGVYVAFPFALENSKLLFEVQGGLAEPGKDQIPGSASDWNTVQNFITVQNEKSQIVFGSSGMPLVQLGDINLGKFQYISKVEKPHIFSWPLNNYWVTNFKDSQEGDLNWSYYFTSSEDNRSSYAARFGWGSRVPLFARVLPVGKVRKREQIQSFIDSQYPNLLLVAARPSKDNQGIIFHFRELEGKETILSLDELLRGRLIQSAAEVNVLEEEMSQVDSTIKFSPYSIKFIKIDL